MKADDQVRLALEQRKANATAKAEARALPFPNPWDRLMQKLDEGATEEDSLLWCRRLALRCAPKVP